MRRNHITNIYDFFDRNINTEKCLFYEVWLKTMMLEIFEAEVKVKRKGLPKAGKHPMVQNKQFLALVKTLKKYKLKDFAESFGVNYEVAKVWNTEKLVLEKARTFMASFVTDYVNKLEEWSFCDDPDYGDIDFNKNMRASISRLLNEPKYYNYDIQWMIIEFIDSKIESDTDERLLTWKTILIALLGYLSERDIFNPPKNLKSKRVFEQNIAITHNLLAKLSEEIFNKLEEAIKNNKLDEALFIADHLKNTHLENLKGVAILKLSILNKGKKRGSEDFEKLYQAVDEKR